MAKSAKKSIPKRRDTPEQKTRNSPISHKSRIRAAPSNLCRPPSGYVAELLCRAAGL
jgi:hypothetical protein